MQFNALLFERVRSGTVASLAIVPLAPLFKAVGLRIGHCGPKFTDLFFNNPLPWQMGASTVLPGLIGHVIFGAVIGLTSKRFVVGTNLRLTWM